MKLKLFGVPIIEIGSSYQDPYDSLDREGRERHSAYFIDKIQRTRYAADGGVCFHSMPACSSCNSKYGR